MEKTKTGRLYTYSVNHWSRGTFTVQAKDATQAKRIVCRLLGLKAADLWCGLSCFTARRIV